MFLSSVLFHCFYEDAWKSAGFRQRSLMSLKPRLSRGPGFPWCVFLMSSHEFQTDFGACLIIALDSFCAFAFCSLMSVILCYLGALLPVRNSLNPHMKNAAHAKTDLIERKGREDRVSFHWLFFKLLWMCFPEQHVGNYTFLESPNHFRPANLTWR